MILSFHFYNLDYDIYHVSKKNANRGSHRYYGIHRNLTVCQTIAEFFGNLGDLGDLFDPDIFHKLLSTFICIFIAPLVSGTNSPSSDA